MKTAISLPDDVFERAERLAKRQGRSRSDLYSQAIDEYVARHAPDDVTEAIDAVINGVGQAPNELGQAAARGVLSHVEW